MKNKRIRKVKGYFRNLTGDLLGYKRCTVCGNTRWRANPGGTIWVEITTDDAIPKYSEYIKEAWYKHMKHRKNGNDSKGSGWLYKDKPVNWAHGKDLCHRCHELEEKEILRRVREFYLKRDGLEYQLLEEQIKYGISEDLKPKIPPPEELKKLLKIYPLPKRDIHYQ